MAALPPSAQISQKIYTYNSLNFTAGPSASLLRERCLQLRQVSTGLNNRMVNRLSKEDAEQAAADLGMLNQGRVVLACVDQTNVLFDYCLYNRFRDGRNEVQRFLAETAPAEGSVERLVLEAKCRAWYSVFGIAEV